MLGSAAAHVEMMNMSEKQVRMCLRAANRHSLEGGGGCWEKNKNRIRLGEVGGRARGV